MDKINWKFYRPYRDKLIDKKNERTFYSLKINCSLTTSRSTHIKPIWF